MSRRTTAWRARTSRPRASSVAALGGLLCGCQPAAAPVREAARCVAPDVAMTFIASRNINRDEDGQPRPVEVRVYQLRSDSRLLSASFEDLWKDDKTTLRDDLVGVDEFPAYPGTRSETKFRASADAHFLAAVGLFRSPLGRSFWTEFEMPASSKDHCAPSPLSFAVYIDQTRLAEGSDHMEDHPDKTRVREVELHFDSPSAGSARGEDPSAHDQGRQP